MRFSEIQNLGWQVPMSDPPALTSRQWAIMNVLGLIFLVMAIFQLLSISDFRDGLANLGIAEPGFWAVAIILGEFWAAASFFKLRLSYAFRLMSGAAALLVAGFWFVANIQVLANGFGDALASSYFFGGYLNQAPGWLTVIEASLLLFATLYAANLSSQIALVSSNSTPKKVKTKRKKK